MAASTSSDFYSDSDFNIWEISEKVLDNTETVLAATAGVWPTSGVILESTAVFKVVLK